MIYIFQMPTGPWVCGTDPALIKKLEPMKLVNTSGQLIEIRRMVNDSVFIEEMDANLIAKNAEGDKYADYAELFAATVNLFEQPDEVTPPANATKVDKTIIVGVEGETDYDMPIDTDMDAWVVAIQSIEIDASLITVLGIKKIRFTEALSVGDNVTVLYNKL